MIAANNKIISKSHTSYKINSLIRVLLLCFAVVVLLPKSVLAQVINKPYTAPESVGMIRQYAEFTGSATFEVESPHVGTLLWTIVDVVPGSSPIIAGETSNTLTLFVDQIGRYDLDLSVDDGQSVTHYPVELYTDSGDINGEDAQASTNVPVLPYPIFVALFLLLIAIGQRYLRTRGFLETGKLMLLLVITSQLLSTQPTHAKLFIGGNEMDETEQNYLDTIKFLTVPPERQGDPAFSGNDIAAIKALEDPVRREIYDKMHATIFEEFKFVNLDDAKRNWNMRLKIIQNMRQMNAGGIKYGYYDPHSAEQVGVSTTSQKWKKGQIKQLRFELKDGENAYDGIVDLLASETKGECAGAMVAAVLGAAAHVNGKEAFNNIHPGELNLNFKGDGYEKHRVYAHPKDKDVHIPGDQCYFKNVDDYTKKMKEKGTSGMWQGENTVYLGGGRYSGLGLDNYTEAQLREKMLEAYELGTQSLVVGNRVIQIRFTTITRPIVE